MSSIRIDVKNDKALVYAPYNPDFRTLISPIGRWTGRSWEVAEGCIVDVNRMLSICYGYDPDNPDDLIDIEVTTKTKIAGDGYDGINMFGRQIVYAIGSDNGAWLGEGIIVIQGKANSRGSRNGWKTILSKGAIFKILDVPKNALEIDNDFREMIDIKILKYEG